MQTAPAQSPAGRSSSRNPALPLIRAALAHIIIFRRFAADLAKAKPVNLQPGKFYQLIKK
jgi:hypothetical protein